MLRSKFYTSLAACILALCLSLIFVFQGEDDKQASPLRPKEFYPSGVQMDIAEAPALLLEECYPRWMQMDITEAPALMQTLILQAEGQLAEISQLKAEEMNYENTFGAFEKSFDAIDNCYLSIDHLSCISDSPELRKLKEEISIVHTAFYSSTINNEALWRNLQLAAAGDWTSALSPAKKRDIQKRLNSFKDNGAELEPAQKKRRHEILIELEKLEGKFEQNIKDATNACALIIKDPAELAGMNESWMEAVAKKAGDKGYGYDDAFFKNTQWLITMNDNRHWDILYDCEHEATRRACWKAYTQIATQEPYHNEAIVHRIAQLRHELAQLLGFENFASYTSSYCMMGSEAKMRQFIEGMIAQMKPAFDKESAELLAFISAKKGKKIRQIAPWDYYYYLQLLEKERYQFNRDELYDYFPQERVIPGMLSVFEQLFNIRFKEKEVYFPEKGEQTPPGKAEIWHPDVRVFELFDASSNKQIGSFYLDLFRRDKKKAGAWVCSIHIGNEGINGKPQRPPLAALCGDITDKNDPLSHGEIQMLFHEMGHLLHFMFSETELRSQGSPYVAFDFAEFPSMLSEQWIWEPQVLNMIAKHYKTGARIPDKMKDKLLRSKNFILAIASMEQLSLTLLDLELHSRYEELFQGKSLDEASDFILKDTSLPFSEKSPSPLHSFTHCISGAYASNYYSYKWGEVLAADAFSRFLKEGVLNRDTGTHLRESILSKGDSAPAMELFKNFMGREPNSDALLEQQGLLPATDKK